MDLKRELQISVDLKRELQIAVDLKRELQIAVGWSSDLDRELQSQWTLPCLNQAPVLSGHCR